MLQSLSTEETNAAATRETPPSPLKSVERRASGPMMDYSRSSSIARSDGAGSPRGSTSYSGTGPFSQNQNLDPGSGTRSSQAVNGGEGESIICLAVVLFFFHVLEFRVRSKHGCGDRHTGLSFESKSANDQTQNADAWKRACMFCVYYGHRSVELGVA